MKEFAGIYGKELDLFRFQTCCYHISILQFFKNVFQYERNMLIRIQKKRNVIQYERVGWDLWKRTGPI